ncbi:hypothetical protein [Streptomyces flavofungini]|uniref:hypothetical protein n=1 Tax=Streptomyces flavofungini TaxID=68200 RepID=UPI0025B1336A|nr:hypothetical protein [Streptomyces flavofungini]WJV47651.1 hypothetical protein QUY26_20255 [Streptomyces flavofungini]
MFETLGAHYDELKILNLIVDRNERRRDLNAGQKAMVALALEPMFAAAQPTGRPKDDGSEAARSRKVKETVADLRQQNVWVEPTARERESAARAAKVVGASGRAVLLVSGWVGVGSGWCGRALGWGSVGVY